MASKRMKNRVYWAHVKAQTYHPGTQVAQHIKLAYNEAFKNNTFDSSILAFWENDILAIEAHHGPAGLRDVHNRDLWTVRERLAMAER